ncbi:MAG: hypothetical protein LBT65_04975 [Synergistaceae bacterium]|jgi:hypothetical protein|nr:hypothetical protein [Synergistaceae bacterium]
MFSTLFKYCRWISQIGPGRILTSGRPDRPRFYDGAARMILAELERYYPQYVSSRAPDFYYLFHYNGGVFVLYALRVSLNIADNRARLLPLMMEGVLKHHDRFSGRLKESETCHHVLFKDLFGQNPFISRLPKAVNQAVHSLADAAIADAANAVYEAVVRSGLAVALIQGKASVPSNVNPGFFRHLNEKLVNRNGLTAFAPQEVQKLTASVHIDIPLVTSRTCAPIPGSPGRLEHKNVRIDRMSATLVAAPTEDRIATQIAALKFLKLDVPWFLYGRGYDAPHGDAPSQKHLHAQPEGFPMADHLGDLNI